MTTYPTSNSPLDVLRRLAWKHCSEICKHDPSQDPDDLWHAAFSGTFDASLEEDENPDVRAAAVAFTEAFHRLKDAEAKALKETEAWA